MIYCHIIKSKCNIFRDNHDFLKTKKTHGKRVFYVLTDVKAGLCFSKKAWFKV